MSSLRCVDGAGAVVCCPAASSGGEVALTRSRLHENTWTLEAASPLSLSPRGRAVSLRTVLDHSRGVAAPFLVSRLPPAWGGGLAVSCHTPDIGQANCGTVGGCSGAEIDLTLLNGPTVVWGEAERVCVALPDIGSDKPSFFKRDIHLRNHIGTRSHTVERVWSFDWRDETILLLIRCLGPAHKGTELVRKWCCMSVKRDELHVLEVTMVPAYSHLPEEYGCLATCVSVCHHWRVGPEGVWPEPCFVVGTTYRQVVVLQGGIPLHCITMETAPTEIHGFQVKCDCVCVCVCV